MILDEIVKRTEERIKGKKRFHTLEAIREEALSKPSNTSFPFEKALRTEDIAFICEVKRASPSKGIIAKDFNHLEIAREYERAGAAAVSVLTEPFYFGGRDVYLAEIAAVLSIPVLRKDFVVDKYMLYEAKLLGASAVLLIAAVLGERLEEYLKITHSLGLSALVEAHTSEEVMLSLHSGARIIGVNNRNLRTFEVDTENSIRLKRIVPDDVLFVSESGIRENADIEKLRQNGINAVLIGEALMRSGDKKQMLRRLWGDADE